jgi:predicted transposase YdaD
LAALEAREPDHPLVAVFKPLFIASVEELVTQAKTHYRKLHDRPLPPGLRDVLCEVFERWMLERLPTKTKHEISMILDLPDVRQTVCGRELLDEGRTEGKAELLALQAETRLGPLPDELKARIRQLPGDAFQALALKVLEWTQVEELQLWLASQPLAPHSTSGSGIFEG